MSTVEARETLPQVGRDIVHVLMEKNAPYLDPNQDFLSPELSRAAIAGIPKFTNLFLKACFRGNISEVNIGGSSMENTDPQAYWDLKRKFIDNLNIVPTIPEGPRHDVIVNALNSLANGDPDLDIYFRNEFQLKTVYTTLTAMLSSSHKHSQIDAFSDVFDYTLSYGPISESNPITRLCFQLQSKDGKKIFHIDGTSISQTGTRAQENRRGFASTYQESVCRRMEIGYFNGKVKGYIHNDPINIPYSSHIDEYKSPAALIESAVRDIRKINLLRSTGTDSTKITEITNIFDPQTFFNILATCSKIESDQLFENQSATQQEMWYKEAFTILMTDLGGLDTLYQLKLFPLIFGFNVTRKDVLDIYSHCVFYADTILPSDNPRLRNRNVSEIQESITHFHALSTSSKDRNGLHAFIDALARVKKVNNGFSVLTNPSAYDHRVEPKKLHPGYLRRINEVLVNVHGGVTAKMLETFYNYQYPDKPLSVDSINKAITQLIVDGAIETVKRTAYINNKQVDIRLLYPAEILTPSNHEQLSEQAINSLRLSDLRQFNPSVLSLLLLDHLSDWQHEIAHKPEADPITIWFDEKYDADRTEQS